MTQKADNGMMDRILGKQTPAPNSTVSPAVANMAFDISIHEILEFSGNPRIYENPMFQSIKESIREPGVLRRLVVTRRPEVGNYDLCQGGISRLRRLKELNKEIREII